MTEGDTPQDSQVQDELSPDDAGNVETNTQTHGVAEAAGGALVGETAAQIPVVGGVENPYPDRVQDPEKARVMAEAEDPDREFAIDYSENAKFAKEDADYKDAQRHELLSEEYKADAEKAGEEAGAQYDADIAATAAEHDENQASAIESVVDPEADLSTLRPEQLVAVFDRGLFLLEEQGKDVGGHNGTRRLEVNRNHGTFYRLYQLKDGGILFQKYFERSGWAGMTNTPDPYNATFYADGRIVDHFDEEKGDPRSMMGQSKKAYGPMKIIHVDEHLSEMEAGNETGITIPGVPGFFRTTEEAARYRQWQEETRPHFSAR
jgi:hypothetical protein